MLTAAALGPTAYEYTCAVTKQSSTFTILLLAAMLRRPPTMIPMNDSDVQEIRELVAQQKAQFEQKQRTLLQMKKIAERPFTADDPQAAAFLKMMAERAKARERDKEERNKRLGIPPGQSSSSCMHSFYCPRPFHLTAFSLQRDMYFMPSVKLYREYIPVISTILSFMVPRLYPSGENIPKSCITPSNQH